jgi:hypothetical protein
MRWERAEDGAGITAGRRWLDGDSISIVVLKVSPTGNGCFRGVNCRSFIERRSSPFDIFDLSVQWTCCFLIELVRDEVVGVLFSDDTMRSSWPDSIYGPLYELSIEEKKIV